MSERDIRDELIEAQAYHKGRRGDDSGDALTFRTPVVYPHIDGSIDVAGLIKQNALLLAQVTQLQEEGTARLEENRALKRQVKGYEDGAMPLILEVKRLRDERDAWEAAADSWRSEAEEQKAASDFFASASGDAVAACFCRPTDEAELCRVIKGAYAPMREGIRGAMDGIINARLDSYREAMASLSVPTNAGPAT